MWGHLYPFGSYNHVNFKETVKGSLMYDATDQNLSWSSHFHADIPNTLES